MIIYQRNSFRLALDADAPASIVQLMSCGSSSFGSSANILARTAHSVYHLQSITTRDNFIRKGR